MSDSYATTRGIMTHGAGYGSTEQGLAAVTERLLADFGGQVPPEIIHAHLQAETEGFRAARITTYLPVLVDRAVRQRLRAGDPGPG